MITALIAAATAMSVPVAGPAPAALPPVLAPALPDARPALWVVNDHDTIIYLFGTFHALDGRSAWFNDEIETAFAASHELILETMVPAAPPKPAPATRLSSDGTVGPYAGSASFLSTSRMVMSAGRSRGMSTDMGADSVLRRAAEQSGKPIGALESLEFQFAMFSRMPATARPPSTPAQKASTNAAVSDLLTYLQSAWNRGDIESFTPMLNQMQAQSPASYKMLFADRNGRWAQWIANRLQQPGTVFVAVGAGHLAGRDSVQQKLAQVGIRSARVN